jgi:hypothetical protein
VFRYSKTSHNRTATWTLNSSGYGRFPDGEGLFKGVSGVGGLNYCSRFRILEVIPIQGSNVNTLL